MNKFLQTTLVSAIMATSGFAAQLEIQADSVFETQTNATLENGTSYVFSNGTTLYNSITIQGPTEEDESADFKMKDDSGTARIVNYKDQLKLNPEFTKYSDENLNGDYYTPEALGKITGNINIAEGIQVIGETIDLIEGGVLQTLGARDVAALIGDDGDPMTMIISTENSLTISQNIANEKTKEYEKESKGLMISGKFELTGDQSHFTEKSVSSMDAEIEFVGEKSLFQTDMEFHDSIVSLNQSVPVSFNRNITVFGGSFNIATQFTLKKGGSLILKVQNSVITEILYGWNYPTITVWKPGETSVINGKTISHNEIINNIKKYSNENNLTNEDMILTADGDYIGIKYSDGVFSYLGTNDESDEKNFMMEKGTTDPEKITKYLKMYPDLVYEGKKSEARTIGYNGGENPYTITNDDGSTFQILRITYDSSKEFYSLSITGTDGGFSFNQFEGNDNIGYYHNTFQAHGGPWRIDKAIYWYFHEWDGLSGAVLE